jgi:hypothetical protein
MRKSALLVISATTLGLAACSNSGVTRSGGAGLEESTGVGNPYASPLHNLAKECLPNDTNCIEFYNSPGGG